MKTNQSQTPLCKISLSINKDQYFIFTDAEINIGPRQITVNNKNITWKSWRTTSPVQINNIFLEFQTKNHLLIKIGDNIEFVVMRHISNVPNPKKWTILGFI